VLGAEGGDGIDGIEGEDGEEGEGGEGIDGVPLVEAQPPSAMASAAASNPYTRDISHLRPARR
jgi:hypothetical protein